MEAYSVDLRKKIINAYYVEKAGSQREVAKIFGISTSTMYKYLKLHREGKSLDPKPKGGNNPPKLDEKKLRTVKEIQLANNDITLEELGILFEEKTGIKPGKSVLQRALDKLNLTRKKRQIGQNNKKQKEYKNSKKSILKK